MRHWLRDKAILLVGREALREARASLAHARRAASILLARRHYAPVSVETICGALAANGVRRGDTLLLHSAIGRLSRAGTTRVSAFDPQTYASKIIDGILELLGEGGTLAVPTAPPLPGVEMSNQRVIFDPTVDGTGTGLIPSLLLKRPGRTRSELPWQNLSALGGDAKQLTAQHLLSAPMAMGPHSPWARLLDRDAKVALLGVDHDRSSTVHILENMMGSHYPRPVFYDKPHPFRIRLADGTLTESSAFLHAVTWKDEDINLFCRYVDERHKIYKQVWLGRCRLQIFRVREQLDAFRTELDAGVSMYDAQFKA